MTAGILQEQARSTGEAAFKAMVAHEVPPTPQNYAVWFAYAEGSLSELKRTIDILLSNRQSFTPELCADLYARFFDDTGQLGVLQDAGGRLRHIVDQVKKHIDSAAGDANAFGQTLDNFSSAIGDSAPDIHALIGDLVAETQKVAERNRKLEERLTRASGEVNSLKQNLETVPCYLYESRITGKKRRARFQVVGECGECRHCLEYFGCPAMYVNPGAAGQMLIDEDLCSGCAFCVQWCPCIKPVKAG